MTTTPWIRRLVLALLVVLVVAGVFALLAGLFGLNTSSG